MKILTVLLAIGLCIALANLSITLLNLRRYRKPSPTPPTQQPQSTEADTQPTVSVCIPARNEQANIESCVAGLITGNHTPFEILVYDDQSTDNTPAIIDKLIHQNDNVRRIPTVELPNGWNGKQHACWQMANNARGQWLLFTDADVRFNPSAIDDALNFAKSQNAALVSTFPKQITGSLAEKLAVPMIHFILLSYLPIGRMRSTLDPAASAGCGQYLLVNKHAYHNAGTHAAFKDSMHDGIKMPRELRRAGHKTDIFDGTHLVSCRMYHNLQTTWKGFTKNAYEGLGSDALLIFITITHTLAHLLPWIALPILLILDQPTRTPTILAAAAVATALTHRAILAARFHQPWIAVPLHPIAILFTTLIQWQSWRLHRQGKRSWRGRTAGTTPQRQPS